MKDELDQHQTVASSNQDSRKKHASSRISIINRNYGRVSACNRHRQRDRQTQRQADMHTDRQADRERHTQIDGCRWTDRQAGKQTDRQTGRQTDRRMGRQTSGEREGEKER